jgi:hypothetical protein
MVQQNNAQRRVMMPQQGMPHQGIPQQGMQQQAMQQQQGIPPGMPSQMPQQVPSQGMQGMQQGMQQPLVPHMSSMGQSPHGQTAMQAIPMQSAGMGSTGHREPGQVQAHPHSQVQPGMMQSSGMMGGMIPAGGGQPSGGMMMQGGGGVVQPDFHKDGGMQDSDEEKVSPCSMVSATGNFSPDHPHPRAHCVVRPFLVSNERVGSEEGGNNEGYCPNCFCYVCEVKASECQVP